MSVLDVISTPLREGRRLLALHALLDRLFQSTPLRDGRRPPLESQTAARLFNPRPSVRGDLSGLSVPAPLVVSIHAPP